MPSISEELFGLAHHRLGPRPHHTTRPQTTDANWPSMGLKERPSLGLSTCVGIARHLLPKGPGRFLDPLQLSEARISESEAWEHPLHTSKVAMECLVFGIFSIPRGSEAPFWVHRAVYPSHSTLVPCFWSPPIPQCSLLGPLMPTEREYKGLMGRLSVNCPVSVPASPA